MSRSIEHYDMNVQKHFGYSFTGCLALSLVMVGVGLVSFSSEAFAATEWVDEVTVNVPVVCSIGGVVNTEHTATLLNGIYSGATGSNYENGIGKTTLTVFCNDNNGFSVYATGFTGDIDNRENSNKLIGINTGSAISSKVYEAGDTTSNWSMKVNKVTDDTVAYLPNNMTIANSYDNWHTVPSTYEQVATYKAQSGSSATDVTQGAKLETTYAAFISSTQPADAYQGKVKYVLVNPYNAAEPVNENQIGVTYYANGSTFAGGGDTNRVVYEKTPMSMYIATTPLIAKSDNVAGDGTKESSYTTGDTLTPITATGATKMKVVIRYGLSSNTILPIIEGEYDGQGIPDNYEMLQGPATGEATYVFEGDAVTFYMMANSAPSTTDNQDYGYYAEVYPVYATEQTGTEESAELFQISVDAGTYATTTNWYGSWYADINNHHYDFIDESVLMDFLARNAVTLGDTNIDLYRGLMFGEAYTKANKAQVGGYYVQQDLNNNICQTVAIGQNEYLKDIRDNSTYLVGRLRDGKCWMLQNLALDPTTTIVTLSSENTNMPTEDTAGFGAAFNANMIKTSGFNSYTEPMVNVASKSTMQILAAQGHNSSSAQSEEFTEPIGVYYNYCAATAGTYCKPSDTTETTDAEYDICPKGWRMPTGGAYNANTGKGEYRYLRDQYSSDADFAAALRVSLSGFFTNSSAGNQGSDVFSWSSTYSNAANMYTLIAGPTLINPQAYNRRYVGLPLRCIYAGE